MSLFLRFRHHLPYGFCRQSVFSPVIALDSIKPNRFSRKFGQPARQVEEDEEVEFDQRKLPTNYDPATFDPNKHHSAPTDRVWKLVDQISSLTLAEVAELYSIKMKKMGMASPAVGLMGPGSQTAAKEEAQPEKTVFDLKLESFEAASKIKIIKEVRSCTDLGLKEAKELVEKTPTVFKKGVTKDEGEQIIEKLKSVGAKVVME